MGSEQHDDSQDSAHDLQGDDAKNRVHAALNHLRAVLCSDGSSHWKSDSTRQKEALQKWAANLGLLLDAERILPHLKRGGQEHDIFDDQSSQRIIKVTRNGVFGLTPGIDLDLVASGDDARRLHLWEATPYYYLERLHLQNSLMPEINQLEGILIHNGELSIVISQPRFEILAVSEDEIDQWFIQQGFQKIASASYYRADDNLGIFDAHDKNVLRSHLDPGVLIPFDIIPCHPKPAFLDFIQSSIAKNVSLHTERSAHTSDRTTKA